jgi:hypothetical protein
MLQLAKLQLTDIRDGRLHLDDQVILTSERISSPLAMSAERIRLDHIY